MKGYALRRLRLIAVLVGHVLMPVWLIWLLATMGPQDTSTWLMVLFAAAAYTSYISVAGSWSWLGVYTQKALPLAMVAAAFITRPRFVAINDSPQAAELRLLALTLGVYFVVFTILALLGRRSKADALELVFPLKSGTYIIGQGGRAKVINRHARDRSQRFAIDILKLGGFGARANGLYPVSLKKYAIFGADVFSPCEGVVVAAVDSFLDQIPPDRDRKNSSGNYVAVESNGATIYLTHLMKDSVRVDVGQRVRLGQVLARVGNSGDSTEPHLHIHAEKGGYTGQFSGQPALAMRFGGRFLVRNDCVDTPV